MYHKTYIYAYLVILSFTACSPTTSYNVKSFFFDGVPNPKFNEGLEDKTDFENKQLDSTILFIAKNTIHPPYQEKACLECHSENNFGRPKMKLPDLCYQCHDALDKSNEYLHGPVASGNCTQCHHPHKSGIENLLKRNGHNLCLQCHDKVKIIQNRVHTNIESKSCMVCHDPHGGENEMMLQKTSCFQCHEDFTANKQFSHGPVAAGQCATCHGTHKSSSPKLLLNTGDQLCLNCHNRQDIYATAYHIADQETACVACHNPHSSNEKYLLILKNN